MGKKMVWIKRELQRVLSIVCMTVLFISTLMTNGVMTAHAEAVAYNSCQDVKLHNTSALNGEYSINVQGTAVSLFCYKMDTVTPMEYLTLAQTGPAVNYSKYAAGGARPGTDVVTLYTRVRINPKTLAVNTDDLTFSSSTGNVTGWVTQMKYGEAGDCRASNSAAGSANINLTGTPFSVLPDQFKVEGWYPNGSTTYSSGNQVVDLTGGGYCGGNTSGPDSRLRLTLSSLSSISLTVTDDTYGALTSTPIIVAVDSAMNQTVLSRDVFGKYVSNALPPDNYTIRLSAAGYVTASFQTGVLTAGQNYIHTSANLSKDATPVTVPDAALRTRLQTLAGGPPLTVYNMSKLTSVDLSGNGIANLDGIETAVRLSDLNISLNNITDISKLLNLSGLNTLDITNNPVDLSGNIQRNVIKAVYGRIPAPVTAFKYSQKFSPFLRDLSVSAGNLAEPFSPGTNQYTVYVGNEVTSLSVTAVTYDPMAQVAVNAQTHSSDQITQSINLKMGFNVIPIVVTPLPGGSTTPVTYTLNIYRPALTDFNGDGAIDIRDVWLGIQQHIDANGNGIFDPYDDVVEMLKQIPPRNITVTHTHPQ